jgi:ribosomal protein L4
MLAKAGREGSCLIITEGYDKNVIMSVRNMRRIAVTSVENLNAFDVLFYRGIVMTEGALNKLKENAGAA